MRDKINIVMVYDIPANLLALEGWLQHPDLNLIQATSGNEALGLSLEYDFALVLLDVQMPEMNGFEVADFLRKNEKTKHFPIIFITAISKEESFVCKGYGSGAVDYLRKPFEPEILKSKVTIFCQMHRQKILLQRQLQEIKENKERLEKQLKEIIVLRGMLPICSNCKMIRDDHGYWETIEVYIREHSEAEFTHSICPKCAKILYPDFNLEPD